MKLSELLQCLIDNQDSSIVELSNRAAVNRSWIYRKLQGGDKNMDAIFDTLTGDISKEELIKAINTIRKERINEQIL